MGKMRFARKAWEWISHGHTLWGLLQLLWGWNLVGGTIGGIGAGIIGWWSSLSPIVLFFAILVGIALGLFIANRITAMRIQKRLAKMTISPELEMGKKKLGIIIEAIAEAKEVTRKGHAVKIYISSDNGLDTVFPEELKDILLKLQDDERVIQIKSFPDWLLPSPRFTKDIHESRIKAILEPSRNHFIVQTLDGFDKWCANYRAEIKNPKKSKLGQTLMQ